MFVTAALALYVVRTLLVAADRLNGLIGLASTGNGIAAGTFWPMLAHYDHTLNRNVPLIGGALLVLGAWSVVHQEAVPRLQTSLANRPAWLLLGLAAGLLLAGVGLYHYLTLYVRYQHNQAGAIIGLKTYSLFRLRTVLADTIGFGILMGAYELLYQYYQFLVRRATRDNESPSGLVRYGLPALLALYLLHLAVASNLPVTLWRGDLRDGLLLLGFGEIIVLAQAYLYTRVLPLLRPPRATGSQLLFRLGGLVLGTAGATAVVFLASLNFGFRVIDPILVFTALMLLSAVGIAYGRQALNREKTVLQAQVSTGAAELASLRAQINPHFLFNALNSLYATALTEKGEKTADGIQKLGDMMRFMLHENNRDRIPLDKEVEYLQNYIALQRLRIDETHPIDIRVMLQEPDRPIFIAPMLLTPFIENAFKYGISLRHASWLYITLTFDSTQLYLNVHNSRHQRPADPPAAPRGTGVGLDNVRKRLQLIYPGRHELMLQPSDQDYFVSLRLVY